MSNQGHAKVATFMTNYPEFAIFRKFNKLNVQNLLYLQAEISYLEKDLVDLADRDARHPAREIYSRGWWYMAELEGEGQDRTQYDKVLVIRQKLKEYNKQLSHQILLSNCKPPKTYDLAFLHDWMERSKLGNFPLVGPDSFIYTTNTHSADLLAITRRTSSTPLTHYITNTLIPSLDKFFRRLNAPKTTTRTTTTVLPTTTAFPLENITTNTTTTNINEAEEEETQAESQLITTYSSAKVAAVVSVLSTVFASMLPISSILILYFVNETINKLAIAVVFTGLFAFCLVVTTGAKRAEVFAATSAFAAVQVVFVTGENGGRSSSSST